MDYKGIRRVEQQGKLVVTFTDYRMPSVLKPLVTSAKRGDLGSPGDCCGVCRRGEITDAASEMR
jgi:hypothetical protein